MNSQEAKKLESSVRNTLKEYLKKNSTIIAGISGGPDSIFLLHFLQESSAKIIIAHLDHQVRNNSKKDIDFLKKLNKNDISNNIFEIKTLNIPALAKKLKKGLEETGRIERYKFFNQLCKNYKADYILTAHHADDNLETILLNFTRGASLKGLGGMPELDGKILRPLLKFSKKEITNYLDLKGIHYLTDPTNKDKNYSRNFLRHEVIPRLKSLNPNLEKTIARNTKNLRESQEILEKKAKTWLSRQSKTQLDAKSLRRQPEAMQKIILLQAYKKLIGDTKNLENAHLEETILLIRNNVGNKEKKLGKIILSIRNNIISLKK